MLAQLTYAAVDIIEEEVRDQKDENDKDETGSVETFVVQGVLYDFVRDGLSILTYLRLLLKILKKVNRITSVLVLETVPETLM